ncbi:lipopolysaccharide heptosyltransferase II [Curvibacter sp. APW13]|uniref:lipopolysaccharide heptosyltransferase II n=1 Tax=Curvibacter sp. APW13 TaxID=3077236 RepID=UPI0028DF6566|nr:lipopolysaccharide heptosyltransferase II [Curvibacter sp. APW13]MDT8990183.1 lipopolysaccharide heptosyltransferase II [Curvibacter sp. APW13]
MDTPVIAEQPSPVAAPAQRSLVIAPQWIGDAIMTEPLLRRLQARGDTVTVAALPWVAPVYRAMAAVYEVVEVPFAHGGLQWGARRAVARQFKGRFEAAYVCPNSFKSALVPWWAGIPRRIGYVGESRIGVLTERLPNPTRSLPMVDFYAALAGAAPEVDRQPRMQLTVEQVIGTLATLNLRRNGYFVVAPGAEYGPAKRWPASHFAALIRSLPLPSVLLGSGKDAEVCAQIAAAVNGPMPGQCTNLAGKTSLDQAMNVIAAARSVISNDSGLMHVAAALGVRQVALFGSSSPEHTPPHSPLAQVVWLKDDRSYQPALDCAPCFKRECPFGHTRCLDDIQPARVLALLQSTA